MRYNVNFFNSNWFLPFTTLYPVGLCSFLNALFHHFCPILTILCNRPKLAKSYLACFRVSRGIKDRLSVFDRIKLSTGLFTSKTTPPNYTWVKSICGESGEEPGRACPSGTSKILDPPLGVVIGESRRKFTDCTHALTAKRRSTLFHGWTWFLIHYATLYGWHYSWHYRAGIGGGHTVTTSRVVGYYKRPSHIPGDKAKQ